MGFQVGSVYKYVKNLRMTAVATIATSGLNGVCGIEPGDKMICKSIVSTKLTKSSGEPDAPMIVVNMVLSNGNVVVFYGSEFSWFEVL